jgi:hypothetical protein
MRQNNRTVLGVLVQFLFLVALILLYALIVTRGRPMDWLP